LVCFALLLAACGGSNSAGGAKKRYIEQADAICSNTLSQLNQPGGDPLSTPVLQKANAALTDAYNKLTALPKSTEDDETLNNFLAQVHNLVLTSDAAVQDSMLQSGATQRVTADLQSLDAAKKAAASTAKDYGFKTCSQL
jgi:tetrahydrodipicolinate N-succinyltransferase